MSRHTYRRQKHFRRSPLSDILAALAAIALIVLLVFVLRGWLLPSDSGTDTANPPPDSSSPGPSADPNSPDLPPDSSSPSPSSDSSSPNPSSESNSPDPSSPQASEIPWYLTLVNPTHALPEDFTVTTSTLSNGMEFDTRALDALNQMLADCRAAGLQPIVCSAYRTLEDQTFLFQRKINNYMADGLTYDEAYAATAVEIAVPGTSEHSLGLAADICALSYQILDDSQENTPEQQWLMAHCTEYGFILRYPRDKESITGIIYEPWHYRYVGVDAAKEITEQGLCLEEYLQLNYSQAT